MQRHARVEFIYTTFPALTETFLQRETRIFREMGARFELHSLWGGKSEFEGMRIRRFAMWKLLQLLWCVPMWMARKPEAFRHIFKDMRAKRPPSALNLAENLLGLAYALTHARQIARRKPDIIHAPWATAPAMAAQTIWRLTGIPYSVGAHAYDVFENGGDWLLDAKLRDAMFARTSTGATRRALIARGLHPEKIALIRRGLDTLPNYKNRRGSRTPLRILSIGRLIEKKGWMEQLDIYAALKQSGAPFEARIVGAGPMRKQIRRRIKKLGLERRVRLLGPLSYEGTLHQQRWADVFVFTGKIAPNGDRDGLPNVIPEALACGVPVVASGTGGAPEVDSLRAHNLIMPNFHPAFWVRALKRLMVDDLYYDEVRSDGRAWVEAHFIAAENAPQLYDWFEITTLPEPQLEAAFNAD